MQHQNTLELTRSALAVIDMQEAFRTKIADFAEVARRISIMVQAAKLLHIPIIITEQYPSRHTGLPLQLWIWTSYHP